MYEQLLSANGDGTGAVDMATSAAAYKIQPGEAWDYRIHTLRLAVVGCAARPDYYTASGQLSNGISITIKDAAGTIRTLTPLPIKRLIGWSRLAGHRISLITPTLAVNTFAATIKTSVLLRGWRGEWLEVTIGDNLSSVGEQYIQAQFSREQLVV